MDELQSGGPVLAAEDVRVEHQLSAGLLAAVLFTVPFLVGTLVEPVALAASERFDRRRVLVGCLAFLSLAELGVVVAPGPWTLAAAIAAWGVGVGLATTVAEVALVSAHPGATERIMARWALWGVLGDLAAPVLFGAAAAVGLGWRWVLLAGALVSLVDALLVATGPPLGEPADDDEEEVPLRVALGALARRPAVWAWLAAAALCSLFDETFVAFGTLWLRAGGVGPTGQGAAFTAFALGGAVGLKLVERLAPTVRGQLVVACVALLVVFPAWLLAPPVVAVPATALLGAAAVPLWPLCTARAYDQGRPALVAALAQVYSPLDLVLPALLGVVADRGGLAVALVLLLVQPVGILLVVRATRRRG